MLKQTSAHFFKVVSKLYLILGIMLAPIPEAIAADDSRTNAELLQEIEQIKARLKQLEELVHKNADGVETAKQTAQQALTKETLVTDKLANGQIPLGHTNLSFSGWLQGTMTWRDHNELASASSTNFGTPFPKSIAYGVHELRADARNSYFALNMKSAEVDDVKLSGRLEVDFQSIGSNTTQNNNGWAPRLRHAFVEVDNAATGWHFVAGQTYALTTPYGNQVRSDGSPSADKAWTMLPSLPIINVGQLDDIGPAGVNSPRPLEFRLIKTFYNTALAVSLDSQIVSWAGNIAGASPVYTGTTLSSAANNQFNNNATQNLSLSTVPDVLMKATWQPDPSTFYETFGIVRSYRDMNGTTNLTGTGTTHGFGGGVDSFIKLWPGKLDITGGIGYGSLGGYAGNGIADVTFDATGKPTVVKEMQGWIGVLAHPSRELDLIAYAGTEHSHSAGVSGTDYGWGNPNFLNSGCAILNGVCNGSVKAVADVEVGAIWRFYNGSFGHVDFMPQITWLKKSLFSDINDFAPSAHNVAVDLTIRFYPY
ncbi:hypothetical protein [Solimicrobium silvestre]|uniref:Uncharacterized protein n=1 Tax=Solimicrobium silvestre TaxID=2099400 RepID=A0A2S9H577_9BURK|nr:hypothetical protein [Solimicrobium silvestre]PRC95128.1 hypothetical protein S2091_0323 [Solimicrobium silvestre]